MKILTIIPLLLLAISCMPKTETKEKAQSSNETLNSPFHNANRADKVFIGSCTSINKTTNSKGCIEYWHDDTWSDYSALCADDSTYNKTYSRIDGCSLNGLVGICAGTILNVHNVLTGAYSDLYFYPPQTDLVAAGICANLDASYNDHYSYHSAIAF